jgi:hypothetical protein
LTFLKSVLHVDAPPSAASIRKSSMISSAPARCRFRAAFALMLAAMMASSAAAVEVFPYDRQLMLDASRMGKVKRLPSLTVSSDGTARVNLWCRTVAAQAAVNGEAIQLLPAPLPEALPQYMSEGQCSPERMAADAELLGALSQVTTWQNAGGIVTLAGPTSLRFRPSDH